MQTALQRTAARASQLAAGGMLRVAASIPEPERRMPALLEMLQALSPAAADAFARQVAGRVQLPVALQTTLASYYASMARSRVGLSGLGALGQQNVEPTGASAMMTDITTGVQQATDIANATAEALEATVNVVNAVGNVYDAAASIGSSPSGGTTGSERLQLNEALVKAALGPQMQLSVSDPRHPDYVPPYTGGGGGWGSTLLISLGAGLAAWGGYRLVKRYRARKR